MPNRRQSHGLTLPQSPSAPDNVVSNILSSLATLDETAQLHWIQETSRQVDHERAYQREETIRNGNGASRNGRHDSFSGQEESETAPIPVVGYRDRSRNGSFNGLFPAPTPSVPMGRTTKQGFFRRFMGFGPKVPIEDDLLIATKQPKGLGKSPSSVHVREMRHDSLTDTHSIPVPPVPEESRPNLVKKKSSNFFRRRPKSAGNDSSKSPSTFSHQQTPPPLPLNSESYQSLVRQNTIDSPVTPSRHNTDPQRLTNGVSSPKPSSPNTRERAQSMSHQSFVGNYRRGSDDAEVTSPVSDVFEKGNLSRLPSSTTTNSFSSESTQKLKKSSQPDKAKQLMGLNITKSLSSSQRQLHCGDGNIAALESEYSDVLSPKRPTFPEKQEEQTREKGPSTEEDRIKETARALYNGDESLVSLGDTASWLMTTSAFNSKVRTAYMELFDFMGLDILTAVRRLCAKLLLKGETQQLDRLLEALAKRWYECNPENGMKDPDVVHAISYSIFLLNTDLHIVDISSSQRMTRQQFVRNTMDTILSQLPKSKRISTVPPRSQPSVPKGKLTAFPSASSPNLSHLVTTPNLSRSGSLLRVGQAVGMARNPSAQSLDHGAGRPSKESTRTAERLSWSLYDEKVGPYGSLASLGSHSAWETQMECVLKDIYSSVKSTPLQQAQSAAMNESSPTLGVKPTGLGLSRSASMMSQASHISESGSSKGRAGMRHLVNRDWLGRSKSQPRLPQYPQESHISIHSERSSMEDRGKSPPNSSSRHIRSSSHGRTPSSMSADSFSHDHGASIGFANSLSQTIIREETHPSQIFVDEEIQEHALILSGPPWAKEGVLKSKRHLDANAKKSKEKGWTESFVVIDKGQMRLFQFDSHRINSSNHVGGGNWQQNANMVGSFLLRQTLASVLPAPGYSKSRPHVWALTLPSGSVFFFEAGTSDLVKEWVASANYWAARTSKEPLRAGVSNMEWGWGDCLAMSDDDASDDGNSVVESHRSTFEMQRSPTTNGKATYGGDSRGPKGDRANIRDWKPPQQSLMGSSLKEKDQLHALESFINQLESEFGQHNDIRPLMMKSFSSHHPNSVRALKNWERKCQYVLREIVKYKTYVEVLSKAITLREDLIEKATADRKSTTSTTPGTLDIPPEPWFDLSSSAPNSVSTANTRDIGERSEASNS